jgi:hypothetical protein
MNKVIRFQPANRQSRAAPGDRGAQILFFTGVRYQRTSEDPRAQAQQPPARQKRRGAEVGSGRRSQR